MLQSGVCTDWAVAKGSTGVGIWALCPGEQIEKLELALGRLEMSVR